MTVSRVESVAMSQQEVSGLTTTCIKQSTCAYCGVGCGVDITLENGQPVTLKGTPEHPANYGRLCVKGTHLLDTIEATNRLTSPQVNGKNTTWTEAITKAAHGFQNIVEQYGPDAVAFYVSGQLLTEDYYVANKLMKGYIGSGNIDTNSRLCMSSAVSAYKRAFGEDIVPCNYEDLEQAELIVMLGSNAAWTHPVLFQRIERAKQINPGAKLVVVDPRKSATADSADLHLAVKPGTDAALYNGLLNFLFEQNKLNQTYIDAHTQGFEAALTQAKQWSLEKVANFCGLDLDDLNAFYQLFAQTEKVISFYSMGINQSSSGVDKCHTIINAHLATGKIAKSGCGPFSITGQPNAMGGREVGGLANQLACHMDIENPEHRDLVQTFWQSPTIATQQGAKAVELFDKVESGEIKAVWIMATNPVVSLPKGSDVAKALEKCELVVVSDCVEHNDTLEYADIKLPATGWLEKNGTVTNSERRISRQRGIVAPLSHAKHDWQIICDVAKAMGFSGFDYQDVSEIFSEFATLSGYQNDGQRIFDISGLSNLSLQAYDRLKPTLWPCSDKLSRLPSDRLFGHGVYPTETGRANFYPITPKLPQQQVNDVYPITLNSGRMRDQWHTMTRTGNAARLNQHTSKPFIAINRNDAEKLALKSEDIVKVSSIQGSAILSVVVDDGIKPKQAFTPIHWSRQFASHANIGNLYQGVCDPISGQPETKQTAIRLKKVAFESFVDLYVSESIEIETDYWLNSKQFNCQHIQIAETQAISEPVTFCQQHTQFNGEWLSFSEGNDTQVICLKEGKLLAVALFSKIPTSRPLTWIDEAFALREIDFSTLRTLLHKEVKKVSRKVCSCFGVDEHTIKEEIKSGNTTVAGLGRTLKCGTNCGSCKPELQSLINQEQDVIAQVKLAPQQVIA